MPDCVARWIATPDGLSLYSESFGPADGEPLLLIMGAMNQGLFWPDAFCRQLAQAGLRVIRYDHRDTGASSLVDYRQAPYTLTELTQDALAVLDGYGIQRAHLLGMSMGGYIAQLLAANHPQRVGALLLLSTTADHRPYMAATMGQDASLFDLPPPTAQFLDFITAAARNPPTTPATARQLNLDGWRATHGGSLPFPEAEMAALLQQAEARCRDPAAAFQHALAVANSPPRTALLANISAPTLVLHGEFDPCLPLAHARHLARHIRGAQLQLLDMGHMLPPALAPLLAQYVIEFIRSEPLTTQAGSH